MFGVAFAETGITLTDDEIQKLKTFANHTSFPDNYTIVFDTRFLITGENIKHSGSQFQLFCGKLFNQNCTFYQVSSDGRTAAWIVAKYHNNTDSFEKKFAFTETNDNLGIYIYNSTGYPVYYELIKETGHYLPKGYDVGLCKLTPQPDGSIRCN